MLKIFPASVLALFSLFLSLAVPGNAQTVSSQVRQTATDDQIILSTTVTDKKGRLVKGLTRENFRVSVDKKPAEIVEFRTEDVPLSVGILVDASASVSLLSSVKARLALFTALRVGLRSFLEASNQTNEYFLVAFNKSPQLLLDWTSDFTAVDTTLGILEPKGYTALYDACYLALDKVQHGRNPKRVLLLITDGQDNISNYSFKQLREELRNSDVLLYAVWVTNSMIAGSSLGLEGQSSLDELSSISGGAVHNKRSNGTLAASDAVAIFEWIATELRQQYSIVIAPKLTADKSKWHKIKVEIESTDRSRPETKHLVARTREGFYWNHR